VQNVEKGKEEEEEEEDDEETPTTTKKSCGVYKHKKRSKQKSLL
jgi:hypothetical protein